MRIHCPHCHRGLEIVPDTPSDEIRCPSCGSQLDVSTLGETVSYRPAPQKTIGKFQLVEHIGRGHFGNVWRAKDTQLQRFVAVKIPRTADLSDSDRQLFLREAQTAAKLRHPNIVTVHEVGTEEDALFIVSDFIQGVTLAEQLKVRIPTPKQAAEWCATVADALHYAHEQGVIHRDMKPGNIMLEGEKPFVLDFGLAKHDGGDFTITAAGDVLGTPAYMSPEQARGESGTADRRSDVYSLGVVLYELLTGRKPFLGGTRLLIHQILNDEPVPPRKIRREIPRDLETICLRAMSKSPAQRYATAKELADDLRRYLAGEPIKARPIRWYERSWRWAKRNPALSIASGIAAAALLLVTIQLVSGTSSPPTQLVHLKILKRNTTEPSANTSEVPHAEVVFWQLDPQTGEPTLENPIRGPGSGSFSVRLKPGNYLVVAKIEGHGFHEVFRHVLAPGESQKGAYNHLFCQPESDGSFTLPAIEVPPNSVANGMAVFPAGTFEMKSLEIPNSAPRQQQVAAFLMDPHEVTIGEYKQNWRTLPLVLRNQPEPATHGVHHVNWFEATAYAEKVGKRLPTETEYEAAATNFGRQAYPWGDNGEVIGEWHLGPVGEPKLDRTNTEIPVSGLFSNVGEWTSSWAILPPDSPISNPEATVQRIVRGAPKSVIMGKSLAKRPNFEPRNRLFQYQKEQNPGLGFRCVRTATPRLRKEDF